MYLVERSAPPPDEKEIIEDIPFMQGVLDFSMIFGERVFKNRDITYRFIAFGADYQKQKSLEQKIGQYLMPYGQNQLFDTYFKGYYWLGKCKSLAVGNDTQFNRLTVEITFDCYPFLIGQNTHFTDIWDDFNFENDVANFTRYHVDGTKTITLFNASAHSVKPEVFANSDFNVTLNGELYSFGKGKSENPFFSLTTGLNTLIVEGRGMISFQYRNEVMA